MVFYLCPTARSVVECCFVVATLLKTVFVTLPVRIPAPWSLFFDAAAASLGCSRSAAVCLALKLGAPILQQHIVTMREALRIECRRLKRCRKVSQILALPPFQAPGKVKGSWKPKKLPP